MVPVHAGGRGREAIALKPDCTSAEPYRWKEGQVGLRLRLGLVR
jgi:hypothetical protein